MLATQPVLEGVIHRVYRDRVLITTPRGDVAVPKRFVLQRQHAGAWVHYTDGLWQPHVAAADVNH